MCILEKMCVFITSLLIDNLVVTRIIFCFKHSILMKFYRNLDFGIDQLNSTLKDMGANFLKAKIKIIW